VIDEIIDLRRGVSGFIAPADDNFYPVTLTDLRLAREQHNLEKVESLTQIRNERFSLMAELAKLPQDMVFFTQITMESAEDTEYLDAMRRANIKGALVGVEAVTPEGLKAVYKDFNYSGDRLVEQLQTFRKHGVHVLGSFILWTADRQGRHIRSDSRTGTEGGDNIRAVCDDDALSWNGGLWPMGEGASGEPNES